jgi:MFS family permease
MPRSQVVAASESGRAPVFAIFIWHGFFLALTKATLDLNTVFPALVTSLVDSKALFGALYAVMLGVPYAFNLFFGPFLQSRARKKPYLLLGIYLRALSFLGMAAFTFFFATRSPGLVMVSLFGWVFLFSFSGGFAGVSYADIIGKLVPRGQRGSLYAAKTFASSGAMLLGGVLIARIFTVDSLAYPANYGLVLAIGAAGLLVASGAFWFIREPASNGPGEAHEPFGAFLRRVPAIVRDDPGFLRFILVENLASFSLMLLPFYMIFAREALGVGQAWVGRYLLFQIGGAMVSNLWWGWLSGRRGSRTVVRSCILMGGLIPLAALLLQPLGPWPYAAVFVLVGFVMSGRQVGFEPYLLDLAPEEKRALYLGIDGTLNITKVVLPVLGGVLMDGVGFTATFLLVVAAMVAGFLLLGGGHGDGAAPTLPGTR